MRIRVILLEDIPEVGSAGEIVTVSEGFARNALFPGGKAALATEKAVSRATHQKQIAKEAEEHRLQELQQQADTLDGTELTIAARTKNDEDIFGTITAAAVAAELRQQGHIEISPRDIKLGKKITKLGAYEATISFGSGIEATIHLNIISNDPEQKASA